MDARRRLTATTGAAVHRWVAALLSAAAALATAANVGAAEPAAPTIACRMETRPSASAPPLYETLYLVDRQGKLVVEEVHQQGRVTMRTRYRRDAAGRVTEKCTFTVDDAETPNGCARLRYRAGASHPYESDDVASDGTIAARSVYTYDRKGREIERRVTRTAAANPTAQTRSYAADGRLERVKIVDPRFGTTAIRYGYSPKGERIQEVFEPDGMVRTYAVPCSAAVLIDAS